MDDGVDPVHATRVTSPVMPTPAPKSPAEPRPNGKFSAALEIPFSRRTWPSMATVEAAGRTGPWIIAGDPADALGRAAAADAASSPNRFSAAVNKRPLSSRGRRSAEALTPQPLGVGRSGVPSPPPRATATPTAPADPVRLANLFGYSLTDTEEIATHKLGFVRKLYRELDGTVAAANADVTERLRTTKWKAVFPFQDHIGILERVLELHHRCAALDRQADALERVIVQAIVRCEDGQAMAAAPMVPVLAGAATFVQLELALAAMGAGAAHTAGGSGPSPYEVMATDRWRTVQARLPVTEEHYYQFLDTVHAWGVGWSREGALTAAVEPHGFSDAEKAVYDVSLYLNSAPLIPRMARILSAQREKLADRQALSFEDLCTLLE